jgi:hypothetical protein
VHGSACPAAASPLRARRRHVWTLYWLYVVFLECLVGMPVQGARISSMQALGDYLHLRMHPKHWILVPYCKIQHGERSDMLWFDVGQKGRA